MTLQMTERLERRSLSTLDRVLIGTAIVLQAATLAVLVLRRSPETSHPLRSDAATLPPRGGSDAQLLVSSSDRTDKPATLDTPASLETAPAPSPGCPPVAGAQYVGPGQADPAEWQFFWAAPALLEQRAAALLESARRDFAEMDRLFDHGAAPRAFSPTMDMRESDESYLLVFTFPGSEPAGVKVDLDGRLLRVRFEQADASAPGGSVAHFERQVWLPGPVGAHEETRAALTNGLLKISVPKRSDRNAQRSRS